MRSERPLCEKQVKRGTTDEEKRRVEVQGGGVGEYLIFIAS